MMMDRKSLRNELRSNNIFFKVILLWGLLLFIAAAAPTQGKKEEPKTTKEEKMAEKFCRIFLRSFCKEKGPFFQFIFPFLYLQHRKG